MSQNLKFEIPNLDKLSRKELEIYWHSLQDIVKVADRLDRAIALKSLALLLKDNDPKSYLDSVDRIHDSLPEWAQWRKVKEG